MKNWYSIKAQSGEEPAEITIYDAIGATWDGSGVTAKSFIAELKALKASKINLLVNSPGGSVFDGLAIYHALKDSRAEITGKVLGVAASAASFVLMACQRVVMPANTFMMIHNASSAAWGDSSEMRKTADWLDKIGDSLVNIYATRTGLGEDDVRALLDDETWLTAEEAKAKGFIDEVEESFFATAQFDPASLPDAVRSAFVVSIEPAAVAAAAPPNEVTAAARIQALAVASGLPEMAAVLALDPTVTDDDSIRSALREAAEVIALCSLVGMPERASAMNAARTRLPEARVKLCEAMADIDAESPVNTARKSAPESSVASINPKDIYAKINAQTP